MSACQTFYIDQAINHLPAVSTETVSMFEAFQAAVAFYPWCDDLKEINAPLLTLIGAKDDWTPASRCEETFSKAKSDCEVDLKVYPEAYHWFDLEGIDQQLLRHTLRYNADAASDAVMKVQQFLGQYLHQPLIPSFQDSIKYLLWVDCD